MYLAGLLGCAGSNRKDKNNKIVLRLKELTKPISSDAYLCAVVGSCTFTLLLTYLVRLGRRYYNARRDE